MRKTLDLVVAAVIVAGGGALAASGALSRIFHRDEPLAAAPTTSAPLVPLEQLFGSAPPPAFRTMRRDEILEMSGDVVRRHAYTVGQTDRWRSLVSDSVVMNVPQRPGAGAAETGQLSEFRLRGAMDLFRDAWGYRLMVNGPSARAEASTRVVEITDVQGQLFPLAAGNRLRFKSVEHGTVELAGRVRPEAKVVTYEMRVTGVEPQGYPAAKPAVPGPVYAIDVQVSTGNADERQHVEVHYAPALGAAVRIRTLGDAPSTEERLVSWEPAPPR